MREGDGRIDRGSEKEVLLVGNTIVRWWFEQAHQRLRPSDVLS